VPSCSSYVYVRVAIGAVSLATCLAYLSPRATATGVSGVDRGSIPGFRWSAEAYRGREQRSGEVICLRVKLIPDVAESELPLADSACGDIRVRPNLLSLVDEFDHPNATVFGMAFPKEIVRVTFHFWGRLPTREVILHRPKGSTKDRLWQRVRVGATAFIGRSCVKRIIGHTLSGPVAYDSGPMHCNG
jgi:hypothetical protein